MLRALHRLLFSTLIVAGCGKTEAADKPVEPAKPVAAADVAAAPAKPVEAVKPVEDVKPVEAAKGTEPVAVAGVEPAAPAFIGACDERQAKISGEADGRAQPWSIAKHLEKNFPDMKVSWLMKETPYQNYVVKTGATNFGRCDDTGCYLFAAPTALIEEAVRKATKGDTHDPAVLGTALGLPAKNFEGPLRMMTLDLRATNTCVRLPVDADPGVWKCQSAEDKDCFKFGGYTSGNVPEVMVINAPVDKVEVKEIQ